MADFLGRLFLKGLFSLSSAFPGLHLFLGGGVGQRRTLNLFSLLWPDPSPLTLQSLPTLPWLALLFLYTRLSESG